MICSDLHNWMNDIDLSILGANTEGFKQYATQIRLEYAHVDELTYRAARDACMKHILYTPNGIYKTPYGKKEYEEKAKVNILAHLDELAVVVNEANNCHNIQM